MTKYKKPFDTCILMFHDMAVTLTMFCDIAKIDRSTYRAGQSNSQVIQRMKDWLDYRFKSGEELRAYIEQQRKSTRDDWHFKKTEDTYGDANFFKKTRMQTKVVARKCLRCEKEFISRDGLRNCADCRDFLSRVFMWGEGVARAGRTH